MAKKTEKKTEKKPDPFKALKKAERKVGQERETGVGQTVGKDGKPTESAKAAVGKQKKARAQAREQRDAARKDVRKADYGPATDEQRAMIDEQREAQVGRARRDATRDATQAAQILQRGANPQARRMAEQNLEKARQRSERLDARQQRIDARQAMNPALGGTGWDWRLDRDPATDGKGPAGGGDPGDDMEGRVIPQDIDWALQQAWANPADRQPLVKMLEDAIRSGELNAQGDYQLFFQRAWDMLRSTEQYKARFPGLARLEAEQGYNPQTMLSPTDYMKMEGLYDAAMAAYQIPGDVFDRRKMIADLVVNQVDPKEMQDRIDMAAAAVASNGDITTKLLEYEGVQPGHLIAFYLNPDDTEAAIKRKQARLRYGAMMSRAGFAGSKADAEALTATFGESDGLVAGVVDRAAATKGLMSGLGDTVDESTVIQGSMAQNEQARRLKTVAAQRAGRFNTSGGAVEGRGGVSGLGSASTT